jgi:hypothetical protein
MKKVLNKLTQVLQAVLAAPVKWPGKAGSILKYIAIGLGILETVMEQDKPPPESQPEPPPENGEPFDQPTGDMQQTAGSDRVDKLHDDTALEPAAVERSEADEME